MTIDTSGSGLNRRGYRIAQGKLLLKKPWHESSTTCQLEGDTPFIDPFCGSGTIAIEACLIAQNIAPGFNRDFVSEEWNIMPPNIYDDMRDEADQQANYDKDIRVFASDIDPEMVEIAKRNVKKSVWQI